MSPRRGQWAQGIYRGNYQPGDGHYSAIGAVTGVGRIAALYRVCYDCGTLMYSSLIARVSLYYLLVLLSLFYNMFLFTFTHEKVELFTQCEHLKITLMPLALWFNDVLQNIDAADLFRLEFLNHRKLL